MPDVDELYEAIDRQKPPIPDALERQHRLQTRHAARRRRGGYAVGAAIVVATLIAIGVAQRGGGGGLTPGASDTPTLSPAPTADPAGALALPPAGAVPTTPVHGTLILRIEDTSSNVGMDVYEDGRLLRHDLADFSDDPSSVGVSVQRLTPAGVEQLRHSALASGLFEDDLSLDRGDGAPYSRIQVDDGTHLVTLTWAWHGIVGRDAPKATSKQATVIGDLLDLLLDRTAWPAGVWQDETETAFVPARYDVCMRGLPHAIGPAASVALLPAPVVDRLWGPAGPQAGDDVIGCTRVSTHDARALAGMFEAAGHERALEGGTAPEWLHYAIHERGTSLVIVFAPVLPNGDAIFIGPG